MTSLSQAVADHWDTQPLGILAGPYTTAADSLECLLERNELYPGFLDLMPVVFPGATILDYAVGPGHDALMFLLNGAAAVYAADVSPRALEITMQRLELHGLADRCAPILVPERPYPATLIDRLDGSLVDHAHAAGILHHATDPVAVLAAIKPTMKPAAELRVMVYSKHSEMYARVGGTPEQFAAAADIGSPINNAWTRDEFHTIAQAAGFDAEYVGSYGTVSDCYRLTIA